jgi:glycerol kinase
MSAYLAAIDQGTTSTRFIVFDRSGRIVSRRGGKASIEVGKRPLSGRWSGWIRHTTAILYNKEEGSYQGIGYRLGGSRTISLFAVLLKRLTRVFYNSGKRSEARTKGAWI